MHAILIAALLFFAQSPTFEVASVKVNTTNGRSDFTPRRSGDRITMHNTGIDMVVGYAYHITAGYQVAWNVEVVGTGWRWCDIEAVAPAGAAEDDVRLMFQALLKDRFKLKVHTETREVPSYDLVAGKGGAKMKAAQPDSRITIDGKPIHEGAGIYGGIDGAHLMGKGATMAQLVASLSGRLGGPVRDRTGLIGTFDYNVVFSLDNAAGAASAPALEVAIQEELGLRLEKSKAPVEVLVIDHVEKPSAN